MEIECVCISLLGLISLKCKIYILDQKKKEVDQIHVTKSKYWKKRESFKNVVVLQNRNIITVDEEVPQRKITKEKIKVIPDIKKNIRNIQMIKDVIEVDLVTEKSAIKEVDRKKRKNIIVEKNLVLLFIGHYEEIKRAMRKRNIRPTIKVLKIQTRDKAIEKKMSMIMMIIC